MTSDQFITSSPQYLSWDFLVLHIFIKEKGEISTFSHQLIVQTMATRPIPFEFYCDNSSKKLTYTHDIPSSLIAVGAKFAQSDAGYIDRVQNVIEAAMKEREPACRAASNPRCGICGSPTTKIRQTPVSWLHVEDNPSVCVWVHGVCDTRECDIQTQRQMQCVMAQVARDNQPKSASAPKALVEFMACKVCHKAAGIKRCARCKAVAYCGKEHQKKDWNMHKRECFEDRDT